MKKPVFIMMLTLLAFSEINGQDDGQKFYYLDKNTIEHHILTGVNTQITVRKREEFTENALNPSALIGIAAGEVIPLLVKKVARLFYKPEKYIKEYGDSCLFTDAGAIPLAALEGIDFRRTGISKAKETTTLIDLNFELKPFQDAEDYTKIRLKDYTINFAEAKIKKNAPYISYIASINIVYYSLGGTKTELSLAPFKLGSLQPKNSNAKQNINDIYQVIPPMQFIERFDVKITEVNSKKVHWDKYLELFSKNEATINSYFIDLVPKIN